MLRDDINGGVVLEIISPAGRFIAAMKPSPDRYVQGITLASIAGELQSDLSGRNSPRNLDGLKDLLGTLGWQDAYGKVDPALSKRIQEEAREQTPLADLFTVAGGGVRNLTESELEELDLAEMATLEPEE